MFIDALKFVKGRGWTVFNFSRKRKDSCLIHERLHAHQIENIYSTIYDLSTLRFMRDNLFVIVVVAWEIFLLSSALYLRLIELKLLRL